MADMFLDKNEIVVSHRGRSSPERRYYAVRGNQGIEVPLVVLVNGQSASASEIVSGAIQDHDRGLIVGETSFGKGLVQTQFPLSEDTALLLTTARYYTPSGRLIQRDYKNVTLYDYHYNPQPPKQAGSEAHRQWPAGIRRRRDHSGRHGRRCRSRMISRSCSTPRRVLSAPQGVGDFIRYYLGARPESRKEFVVGRRGHRATPEISRSAAHQVHRAGNSGEPDVAKVADQARSVHQRFRTERRL